MILAKNATFVARLIIIPVFEGVGPFGFYFYIADKDNVCSLQGRQIRV